MPRKVSTVIDDILAALPNPAPPEVADNITSLVSELRIISRTGAYAAPEGTIDNDQWNRLSTTLYRYMPKAESYPWAQHVSDIVTGGGFGA